MRIITKTLKAQRYLARLLLQPTTITIRGDIVSFPSLVGNNLRKALYSENFESVEADSMKKTLNSNDKVLDLGASIGCITLAACHIVGSENVTAIEANPALAEFAESNFSKNNFEPDYRTGLASNQAGKADFKISQDFWASSVLTKADYGDQIVQVDQIDCNQLISEKAINSITCDIEGYESVLLPQLDLEPIEKLIIELHPAVYGDTETSKIIMLLLDSGFHYRPYKSQGDVYSFTKSEV